MVDIEAAIGYVVAHGDEVDRARVAWLVSRRPPPAGVVASAEAGQVAGGGWPAMRTSGIASLDATCFRLAELDDLGALSRPGPRRALNWLAAGQRPDGTWEEHRSLAGTAPEWAMPGDSEARLFMTTNVGYWLAIADAQWRHDPVRWVIDGQDPGPRVPVSGAPVSGTPVSGTPTSGTPTSAAPVSAYPPAAYPSSAYPPAAYPTSVSSAPGASGTVSSGSGLFNAPAGSYERTTGAAPYAEVVARGAGAFRAALGRDGRWPSFLMTGWFGAALLFRTGWYYESAQVRAVLTDRVPTLTTEDVASMAAVLRRAGVPDDDRAMVTVRDRLAALQHGDGAWRSDEDPTFDVHTTVTALRALV